MELPHTIDSQSPLPNAAAILMAAQDSARRPGASPMVPVAPKSHNALGGIPVARRFRRAVPAAPAVQGARMPHARTGFTRYTHHARVMHAFELHASRMQHGRKQPRATALLMAASQRHTAPQLSAYGLLVTPPTMDILDCIQRRAQAIVIRDTLMRRLRENAADTAQARIDGQTNLPRLIRAEQRFGRQAAFKLAI